MMFALFLTGYSFLTRVACKTLSEEKKSWILSLFITVLLSYEGLVHSIPALLSTQNTFRLVFSGSDRGIYACEAFVSYCILDCLMGFVDYPSYFNEVEGYVHHFYYIIQLSIFLMLGISHCFWIFSFCEIPTLLRALHKLEILYVSKSVYTSSFIFFRVLLFAVVMLRYWISGDPAILSLTLPPAFFCFGVHCWWSKKLIANLYKND